MTWYGPAGGPVSGWDTGTDSIPWSAINSLNGSVNTGIAGQLDFVGNTNNPGAYFANYGGFLFFRMRVNVGTVTPTTFSDSHLVLIDVLGWNYPTNGQTDKPDFGVAWDSKSSDPTRHGEEMQIPATLGPTNAIWKDISMDDIDGSAGDKIAPPDINTTGQGYIRTIDGQAAISTNNTTFIDFAVARSYLNPIPVPSGANTNLVNILNHDFRLQFASIANATDHNKINGDVAGPYTLDSTVTNSWSETLSAHLDILWTGAQSNSTWDLTSTNWRDAPSGLNPSAPDLAFISGDDVWFGNQAASNSPITVSTNIVAGTMTVTNTTGTVIFRSNSITASSLKKTEAGHLTFSNSLALYGTTNNTNGVFLNTGSGNIAMVGAFTQGELRQAGTGTITLSASNSYAGGTTISNGVVVAGTNGAIGSGFLTVSGGTFSSGSYTQSVGAVTLDSGAITGSGTITGTSYSVLSGSISATLAGSAALTKSSAGTVTLSGSNSYTGATVISGGSLVLGNTGGPAISQSSGITVTNSSQLVLGASNQIGDSVPLILGGGTLLTGDSTTGYADDLGTLTLSANSTIDLGSSTTTRNLVFDASNAISWTSGQTLTIANWQGTTNGGTYGRIYFGSDSNGLTSSQLAQISFDISGTLYGAKILSTGELVIGDPVPIPEPRVYLGAAVLVLFVIWRERRRIATLFRRPAWLHSAVAMNRPGSRQEAPQLHKIPGRPRWGS